MSGLKLQDILNMIAEIYGGFLPFVLTPLVALLPKIIAIIGTHGVVAGGA